MVGIYERDAVTILAALERNPYTNLTHLRALTNIPETELRRYLNEEFHEYWLWSRFRQLRDENRPLYMQLLKDVKMMPDKTVQVNTSKNAYLHFYANFYGYRLEKTRKYPFIEVFKRREGETFPAASNNLNLSVEIND